MDGQNILAAVAGSACAVLLVLAYLPITPSEHHVHTGAKVRVVNNIPVARSLQLPVAQALQSHMQGGAPQVQVPVTPRLAGQGIASVVFAASGLTVLVVAIIKLLRPTPTSMEFTTLSLSAESEMFRQERERREREKVAQKQREIQERLQRLAKLGAAAPERKESKPSAADIRASSPSMYLDPAFQRATIAAFPSKANATVEEARVLWKLDGYSIVDIRSDMEGAEGRIRGPNKGSIDIPLFNAKSIYDSNMGRKVTTQEANPKWLEQFKARFPDKNAKVIIMCSDGTRRSSQAIDLLVAEGYRSVVLMRGGFNRWDQIFDRQLALRSPAQQAQKAEWLDDPVEWNTWATSIGKSVPPARTLSQDAAPISRTVRDVVAVGSYLDPAFQQATIASFPAKANATVEEARVLWKSDNYSILDVRSDMEGMEGRIRGPNKGSIDIPLFNARSVYDSNLGKKVTTQQANAKWLDQVKARFPDKSSKIIVMCSDGRIRSSQALDLLAAQGYTNLVLMRGGYNRWDQIFDRQLALRSSQQQAAKAAWLDDDVQWGSWASSVGMRAPPARSVASSAAPSDRTVRETGPLGRIDSGFQAATTAAFQSSGHKASCTVEEARVLWNGAHSILDIRSDLEGADGRIRGPNKGSVDIPLLNAKSTYDSTLGKKVVTQERNSKWLDQVRARFPKDAKIIIMCSDGTARSSQAAQLLQSDGFRDVVVMEGGFRKWDQLYDNRLGLRPLSQQQSKAAALKDPIVWSRW